MLSYWAFGLGRRPNFVQGEGGSIILSSYINGSVWEWWTEFVISILSMIVDYEAAFQLISTRIVGPVSKKVKCMDLAKAARSVLPRPRADILPVQPSHSVNKIYVHSLWLGRKICIFMSWEASGFRWVSRTPPPPYQNPGWVTPPPPPLPDKSQAFQPRPHLRIYFSFFSSGKTFHFRLIFLVTSTGPRWGYFSFRRGLFSKRNRKYGVTGFLGKSGSGTSFFEVRCSDLCWRRAFRSDRISTTVLCLRTFEVMLCHLAWTFVAVIGVSGCFSLKASKTICQLMSLAKTNFFVSSSGTWVTRGSMISMRVCSMTGVHLARAGVLVPSANKSAFSSPLFILTAIFETVNAIPAFFGWTSTNGPHGSRSGVSCQGKYYSFFDSYHQSYMCEKAKLWNSMILVSIKSLLSAPQGKQPACWPTSFPGHRSRLGLRKLHGMLGSLTLLKTWRRGCHCKRSPLIRRSFAFRNG